MRLFDIEAELNKIPPEKTMAGLVRILKAVRDIPDPPEFDIDELVLIDKALCMFLSDYERDVPDTELEAGNKLQIKISNYPEAVDRAGVNPNGE